MQGYWFARPMDVRAMEARLLDEQSLQRPPLSGLARRLAAR
jgi:hypothetical protein